MKTLGLIGGLSWYSTAVYYRTLNQLTNERLGGSHSAKLILYSVDFNDFKVLQERDDWVKVESMLFNIAKRLEDAGADCIVMCTNTPHLVADEIRKKLKVPLLHIAEETAKEIVRQSKKKVGLLGTKFTMENSFFVDRLAKFGITSIVPSPEDRDYIHASIFNELTKGHFKEKTKSRFLEIVQRLEQQGAEGVIFGCTEFSLLLSQSDCRLIIFDTTAIHARSAVDFSLSD